MGPCSQNFSCLNSNLSLLSSLDCGTVSAWTVSSTQGTPYLCSAQALAHCTKNKNVPGQRTEVIIGLTTCVFLLSGISLLSACCLMPENVFIYFIHSYDGLWQDGYFSISYIVISRSVILKPIQFRDGMYFSKEKMLFSFRHFSLIHPVNDYLLPVSCLRLALGIQGG